MDVSYSVAQSVGIDDSGVSRFRNKGILKIPLHLGVQMQIPILIIGANSYEHHPTVHNMSIFQLARLVLVYDSHVSYYIMFCALIQTFLLLANGVFHNVNSRQNRLPHRITLRKHWILKGEQIKITYIRSLLQLPVANNVV